MQPRLNLHTRRSFALAFLGYLLLTCVVFRPLVWHIATVMPHDLGDPLLSTAILWWNAHAIPFTERWWNGFAFYPATGFMAFSDPRVGESLLATPLQWLGLSPAAAHNVTFLATFPLCAIAAHWLAFVVTKRHDAAAIAGLVYGFCPYRAAHIPHLELLAGFGMPVALGALHRWTETRARRWLVLFALALVVQGLASSYYLLFFSVLLGLWLVWFVRPSDQVSPFAIPGAVACVLIALLPLALGYGRIHAFYGLQRHFDEITRFSADATSLLTAHSSLWLWGWTSRWAKSEGELFPGATIMLLAFVGTLAAWWSADAPPDRVSRLSRWLLLPAAVCGAIAWYGWTQAPWRMTIAGLSMSSDAPYKPLTLAVFAVLLSVALSSGFRAAVTRRSRLAFYAVATFVLFFCSLGPKPTLAGHQFLYEPPYAWLMRLPLFESVRAPARFGAVAMLALAMTGALAFARCRLAPPARRALALALLAGIAADGWVSNLATPPLPDLWDPARAAGFSAVLELPLGDPFPDFVAMYRATGHGRPVVNGASGFEPTHYFTLRSALEERDPTALDALPGRLLVVVDKREDKNGEWDRFVTSIPRASRLAPDDRWAFYAVEPLPPEPSICSGHDVPIAAVRDERGPTDLAILTDADEHTWWATPHPQCTDDQLVLELDRIAHPCAVTVAVGEFRRSYPRSLIVETSVDGTHWTLAASRRTAGLTMKAALDNPRKVSMPIALTPGPARFVRLRIGETQRAVPWQVTDVTVIAR